MQWLFQTMPKLIPMWILIFICSFQNHHVFSYLFFTIILMQLQTHLSCFTSIIQKAAITEGEEPILISNSNTQKYWKCYKYLFSCIFSTAGRYYKSSPVAVIAFWYFRTMWSLLSSYCQLYTFHALYSCQFGRS